MNRHPLRLGAGMIVVVFWSTLLLVALYGAPGGQDAPRYVLAGPATLPPGTYAGTCEPWVQVNDDAFGLDDPSGQTPPYPSEDSFEVTIFNGQLYLGMEADNRP